MSIEAMNFAYSLTVGSPTRKAVFVTLANMADQEGKCWPSVSYISKRTELSTRTVTRSLHELVELGHLEIEARFNESGQKSNLYRIGLEGVTECQGVTEKVVGGDTVTPRTVINNHIIYIGAQEEFSDYLKMRRLKKAPWTDRAATLSLNKLNSLSEDPETQRQIIGQSADKGWTTFYAIPGESKKKLPRDDIQLEEFAVKNGLHAQGCAPQSIRNNYEYRQWITARLEDKAA